MKTNIFALICRISLACVAMLHISCADTTRKLGQNIQSTQTYNTDVGTDFLMLKAADFMNQELFLEAADIYDRLYKQTKDIYFLKQIALAKSQAGSIELAVEAAKQYQTLSKNLDDVDTNLIIAEDHIRKKQYNLAIILLEKNIAINPSLHTHYVLSNLYLQENMPKKAVKHFISVYDDPMSSGTKLKLEALNQIVAIYLKLKEVDNALHYLNMYIADNEYSLNLQTFFPIYAKANKLDMLQENLAKRFHDDKSLENARMLVAILAQLKHYDEAIKLLKENKSLLGNDGEEMLMQVYVEHGDFKSASKIASKLYAQTKKAELLGLSAVYEYEAIESKNKQTLKPIINTLKDMLTKRTEELKEAKENLSKNDAFFYNFLGYLMIIHDFNIDEGMQYVSKALAIEPTSIEYLDSLAWGFYKKGDCKQAKETFELISPDKLQDIPELIEHSKAIRECR